MGGAPFALVSLRLRPLFQSPFMKNLKYLPVIAAKNLPTQIPIVRTIALLSFGKAYQFSDIGWYFIYAAIGLSWFGYLCSKIIELPEDIFFQPEQTEEP